MRGLLNGLESLEAGDLTIVVRAVWDASVGTPAGVTLGGEREGRELWSVTIDGLRPHPVSPASNSVNRDFKGLAAGGRIVIAGDPFAVVLDRESGAILRRCDLAFVGRSSLDVLILQPTDDGIVLISTKRAWVIDWPAAGRAAVADVETPISEYVSWSNGSLSLIVWNTADPAVPLVSRSVAPKTL